jgi:predicted nucleotidyltransferase
MNTSLNISDKIEPEHKTALLIINGILSGIDVPFFIVGALARDFVMEFLHDVKAPRMTMDIDLAVRIESWDNYEKIQEALTASGFKKSRERQRFEYGQTLVDIVPFGKITDEKTEISWPPEHEIIMSVAGFEDAYHCSTKIQVSTQPNLEIRVPTIPGMAIMKLLSWEDTFPARSKDALDLYFLLHHYKDTDIVERIFVENKKIFDEEGFDEIKTSIRLLGQDMAKICSSETLDKINKILKVETAEDSKFKLVIDMMAQKHDFEDVLSNLEKLRQGLDEI